MKCIERSCWVVVGIKCSSDCQTVLCYIAYGDMCYVVAILCAPMMRFGILLMACTASRMSVAGVRINYIFTVYLCPPKPTINLYIENNLLNDDDD